jgi:short-subunit dehydrogenase
MTTNASLRPIVLITGCASGIGRALALAFHQQGHAVCATARRLEALSDLADKGLMTRRLDVTDHNGISTLLAELTQAGYTVDTLVNNAGYGAMGPVMDVPHEEWLKQFDVNVFAPMALTRAVLPGMVARRHGRIVNISSVSGVMATPFAGPYCASKAAFNAVSDSLRMELAPLGIQVTTVQPGGIQSSFGDTAGQRVSLAPDSPYQAIREAVMGRASESQNKATPADVFAREMVTAVMGPACPPVLRIGEKSRLLPALKQWLPEPWLDKVLSKKFGLDRLR